MRILLFTLAMFAVNLSFAQETSTEPDAQLQKIIEMFRNDQADEARSLLDQNEDRLTAFVDQSADAEAHLMLGRAYFYAEMDSKATREFETAIRLDPTLADAHFFNGLIRSYSGDPGGASQAFQNAIEVDGGEVRYFVELGRSLEALDDRTSAATAYEGALSIDASNFAANYNLAMIYAELGELGLAEKYYLAAIDANSADPNAHYNLGQLYQNTGQHSSALLEFEAVVKLDPLDWRALSKIVQESEAVGDVDRREAAVDSIYTVWKSGEAEELMKQGFYIRDQFEVENGKVFALEYFELAGDRPRKLVFNLTGETTDDTKFVVSLGSYATTILFARANGDIGADERLYHLDGYSPDGSHFTYGFFGSVPNYDFIKETAIKAFDGEAEIVSSTTVRPD